MTNHSEAPVAPAAPVEVAAPEPEKSSYVKVSTVGFDARFPNQNQTKNCWQNYVDYHKCLRVKEGAGEDAAVCWQFKRAFGILCPTKWTERWDEERERNVFPALVDRKAAAGGHGEAAHH